MKIILLFLTALSWNCWPHPVIYKGGWVFEGSFMPSMNELNIGHSFSPYSALVANSNYFANNNNYQDYTLGANFLVKRWLSHDSQANIYLGAHGGYFTDSHADGLVAHSFFMADWETRKHYLVAKSKGYFFDQKEQFDYTFRYGFAPFIAGMDALQTWMILQIYYFEQQNANPIVTPMIRFFYKNVLWEIGYSTRGQSFLTLMVHY